jgi:ribonuclease III
MVRIGHHSGLLGLPAMQKAEVAAPGVHELRDLQRAPGHRGRIERMGRAGLRRRGTALERRLGVVLKDRSLWEQSLTHRSFAYERGGLPTNERLEFLGDAVLGIVITDQLYGEFPDQPEGDLAKMRAALVNMTVLADVARAIGLGNVVKLGRGEELTGGKDKSSILADTLEAVFGAIYLDRGVRKARKVILRLFLPRIRGQVEGGVVTDYKTALQEMAAAQLSTLPEYVLSESGPDHNKRFKAVVSLAGASYGTGAGRSKKEAEQAAARVAVERLRSGILPDENEGEAG